MTGWAMRGLPKTWRWLDHLKHCSTISRAARHEPVAMTRRSWLKLERMTLRPSFSLPSVFSIGTSTSAKGQLRLRVILTGGRM